jgi:hypothetical protein
MIFRIIRWSLALPLGFAAYFYDDALWGPVPIALMNNFFGWPYGFVILCVVYFTASFIASYLILNHYDANVKRRKSRGLKKKLTSDKKVYAYKLLIAGKWAGLAVSCFTLGAILTSVVVGRLQLFKEVNRITLSLIMSGLFVGLFMGFYGGIFSIIINHGIVSAILLLSAVAIVFKIWQLNQKHQIIIHNHKY